MSRLVLEPTADHPITIEPTAGRVLVKIAGQVVADTSAALTLEEAGYDPVQYIPIRDIDEVMLRPSDTTSYCPYKGDAGYFSADIADQEPLETSPGSTRSPSCSGALGRPISEAEARVVGPSNAPT
jgi:uncharacterized protein (DUF427 family)